MWWQPYLPSGISRSDQVATGGLFFIAAALATVLFGGVLAGHRAQDRVFRFAWLGSGVLGFWSIVLLGIVAQRSGVGFLPGVVGVALFGGIVFLPALLLGFVVLYVLMSLGELVIRPAQIVRRHWRTSRGADS
jgi:hypothetical protein